jgi:hypothetical protein
MKLSKHLLVAALLISFGLMASCTGQAEPQNLEEPANQEPTLIMFYTDNRVP